MSIATLLGFVLLVGQGRTDADCDSGKKSKTVNDLNSTSGIGPIIGTTKPKPIPIPGGGSISFGGASIGFSGTGGLTLSNGAISGTFDYTPITWTGECTSAKIQCFIEDSDGNPNYQVADHGPISSGGTQSPATISGNLADLKTKCGSVALSDLWFRAYWKCVNPDMQKIKIFEIQFK